MLLEYFYLPRNHIEHNTQQVLECRTEFKSIKSASKDRGRAGHVFIATTNQLPPTPPTAATLVLPTRYSLRRARTERSTRVRTKVVRTRVSVKSIWSYSGMCTVVHVYGQMSELEPIFCECNHTHARTHALPYLARYALTPMCAHALPGRVYSMFVSFLVARTLIR